MNSKESKNYSVIDSIDDQDTSKMTNSFSIGIGEIN